MEKYRKRHYASFAQLRDDLKELSKVKKIVKANGEKDNIDDDFRERLMLAVTGVNDCSYCTYIHSKLALKSGVNKNELCLLLEGKFDNCPEDQIPAILYAQHWADSNANPSEEAKQKLVEAYGEKKSANIEMYLRMIRLGNLSGNTFDWLLYKLSRGKIGLKK
ncbi:MAG: carboxymuconolactone decarboxylase family protein [Vulcanibacillus sp.]